MGRFIATTERWALAVWVGSLAGFAFVFAPIAFGLLRGDLDTFAAIAGGSLGALAVLGYVCGAASLITSAAEFFRTRSRAAIARAACIVVMVALVAFSQRAIVPEMIATQQSFHGSFNSVAKDDPRRVRYDALHAESSRTYGVVLILGLAAIALSQ
jgi:hypothetical protein